MINILIDRSGKTSKENIFLGNQHENLDETLHFSFPKEYDNFYKYITYSYTNNGCRITGISPLVDDNFIVTSRITKCAGVWELNLICKISPVNLDDKVIDLTENNSTKEHIFISNTISACVSGNSIDVEAFNNVAVDENIASLYDSVLALKNRVEENDKLHEQNEAIRKANELERQEAETTRKANESERVSAEQLRVEAENIRKADETKRQSNESARIEAETNRDTAESERVNAENQRAEAETARQSAEANRESAERARVEAENKRDSVITKLREDLDANTKADGRTQRSLTALWDLNKGISYRFEDDTTKAYQKQVPNGAKLGAVKTIGGRTILYNQYFTELSETGNNGVVATYADNVMTLNGTAIQNWFNLSQMTEKMNVVGKFYVKMTILKNDDNVNLYYGWLNRGRFFDAFSKGSQSAIVNQTEDDLKLGLSTGFSGFDVDTVFNDVKLQIIIVNLTQIFGSGNEPTTVAEFEKDFPSDYYPYNEGTLMSMGTKEVVNVGKNMFKCENFSATGLAGAYKPSLNNFYGTSINSIEPSNKVTVTQSKFADETVAESYTNGYFCTSFNPIVLDENYMFSFDVTPTNKLIDNAKIIILLNGVDSINVSHTQDLQVGKTTRLYFSIVKRNNQLKYIEVRNGGISGVFENFQIEKGDTATTYSPYHESTYPISQAILSLEGYGWGVNNVYNYVDYENKKFYKYVGRVDLSTLDYTYVTYTNNEGLNVFRTLLLNDMKKDENAHLHVNNLLCSKYVEESWSSLWVNKTDKVISQSGNAINITDSSFTDAEAFKQSLQGVYLYYELETPIITDISDVIGDTFQEPFEVEGGGSLTFKNTNGDGYQLAVPSNVQYTIKLNEVTS